MIDINGYEIASKIADADEVEIMEFNFSDCFTALHEYERLKKQNDQLIKTATKLYAMLDKIATSPRCAVSVAPDIKNLLAEARGE